MDTTFKLKFTLNGKEVALDINPWESALSVIRQRLGLTGTKEGCGIGECGACSILVDGMVVDSCLMLGPQLNGRNVETIEGAAADSLGKRLESNFLSHGSVQCGFCCPGMLLSAKALLRKKSYPTRDEIIDSLSGNLCRCTGYRQIADAVESASKSGLDSDQTGS